MKKILISAYSLEVGGIESSLINMLKAVDSNKFQVTLLLQKKSGELLNEIPKDINIREYSISTRGNRILRRIVNRSKLLLFTFFNYRKYEVAIHYATYDIPSSIICRFIAKKKVFWIHSDYSNIYSKEEMKSFFLKRKVQKYDKIVFVSNEGRDNFTSIMGIELNNQVINNIIDIKKIEKEAQHEIDINFSSFDNVFIFVGRLEEKSKRISRLLEAYKIYSSSNSNSCLWIVGNGSDKELYINWIRDTGLQDNVLLLGETNNPYKYISKASCLVLTSDYEGFPVVILEALTLKKRVISTIDVSSSDFRIGDYARIVPRDSYMIAKEMENISLMNSISIDYEKENNLNKSRIIELLEET